MRETRERVRAAIANAGFEFPLRRIAVSLAPGSVRRAGPGLDLAIAAAVLAASGQLDPEGIAPFALLGELGLDGSVRRAAGALPAAEAAREAGHTGILVAAESAGEAALAQGVEVIALDNLAQLALLGGAQRPAPAVPAALPAEPGPAAPDLAELRGQPELRRALEVAAAGGHSLLLIGPPGAGKSLAAARLPGILPPLSRSEALEVARVASACGRFGAVLRGGRPFRAPHHTISAAGLLGGGRPPLPGEVTLADRGVLFLDQLAEFRRDALAELAPAARRGSVCIRQAGRSLTLPARFLLIAAAEGCPCGRGPLDPECVCAPEAAARYRERLLHTPPAPFDLAIAVAPPSATDLAGKPGEPSAAVRERVAVVRGVQERRLGEGRCNGQMSAEEVRDCGLERKVALLLERDPNPGSAEPVVRAARTLADLEGAELVSAGHIAQAHGLRIATRA